MLLILLVTSWALHLRAPGTAVAHDVGVVVDDPCGAWFPRDSNIP